MKEKGLYYPNGTYKDKREVGRRVRMRELGHDSKVVQNTPFPRKRDFGEWTQIITRQQQERKEVLGIPEAIEVTIETSKPILLGLWGDVHAGGDDVAYDVFAEDVNLLHDVKGYSLALGDLTDSYFFMPEVSEQLVAGDEQVMFMNSALDLLSEDGHLLAAWGGDHDVWGKDKAGAHTLYADFHDKFNSHYLEGVSYVQVNLDDGGEIQPYYIIGSHRHKGFSVYNDVHASWRQYNDEAKADTDIISITAHNHTKGYLRQSRKAFGGNEINIHAVALGAYKVSDRYSRKKGWPRKGEESMGGMGLILHPEQNKTEVFWTIEEAVEQLSRY